VKTRSIRKRIILNCKALIEGYTRPIKIIIKWKSVRYTRQLYGIKYYQSKNIIVTVA